MTPWLTDDTAKANRAIELRSAAIIWFILGVAVTVIGGELVTRFLGWAP